MILSLFFWISLIVPRVLLLTGWLSGGFNGGVFSSILGFIFLPYVTLCRSLLNLSGLGIALLVFPFILDILFNGIFSFKIGKFNLHHPLSLIFIDMDNQDGVGHFKLSFFNQKTPTKALSLEEQLWQQGNQALEAGKNENAEVLFHRLIQQSPDSIEARNMLSAALLNQGKLTETISVGNQALELDHENGLTHLYLGIALTRQKHLEEAIQTLEKALNLPNQKNYPASVHVLAYNTLGLIFSEQGKKDKAINAFEKAVALNSNSSDFKEPQENLDKAREIPEESEINSLIDQAIDAYNNGQFYLLETIAQNILELDINHAEAYNFLGISLLSQKKFEDAEVALRKGIKLDTNDEALHYNLGKVLIQKGQFELAITSFESALALNPDNIEAQSHLRTAKQLVAAQPKDIQAIVPLLQQAVEASQGGHSFILESVTRQLIDLAPTFAEGHNMLGIALMQQQRIEESITTFQKAAELDPKNPEIPKNLGTVFYFQGKLEEAITAFQKALNLPNFLSPGASTHTLAYNGLGAILMKQQKFTAAIAAFESALAIDPDFIDAQNNLQQAQELNNNF